MSSGNEKTEVKPLQSDDDAACGKFWEIYANEAKGYDEGLVKGWKDDMDVILVFSGLYSAVLTAFIIESYQKLEEDPADVSAQLLKTISQQLAVPLNAYNVTQTSNDPFVPTKSALVCNILWFISLSLALICAFLAMFIQQWCRHFIHRISLDRSPTTRARLIQFFYFGLKEHRMHIIVDVIPYLLHVSLFYFFGGLSAFLWSINRSLAWLILAVLALLMTLYAIITLLPVFSLSSPYQTPLSTLFWRLRQGLKRISIHWSKRLSRPRDAENGLTPVPRTSSGIGVLPEAQSMGSDANSEWSGQDSPEKPLTLLQAMIHRGRNRQSDRESDAVEWTLKSLNDEKDFLPFIEALPGVLESRGIFRLDNLHLLKPILESKTPHQNVIMRAHWLLLSGDNIWHTEDYRKRCRPGILKFFWVLARLLFPYTKQVVGSQSSKLGLVMVRQFSKDVILSLRTETPQKDYSLSIMVLCMLHNCRSLDETLSKVVDSKVLCDLITTGDEIFKTYSCRNKRGFLTAGWHLQFMEQLTFADVASHLFYAYLQVAGTCFPSGFKEVCSIFYHHNIKPINQGPGVELLACLTFQLYLLDDKSSQSTGPPSLEEFDSIFKVILKSSTTGDLPGIASYINRRVELGWWTAGTLQDEELRHLCKLLTEALHTSSPSYGTAAWVDTCKWIIAYAHKYSGINYTPILSMLESIIRSPDLGNLIENHPSLIFFVKLAIIKDYNYSENDACRSAHKLLIEALATDERYKDLILNTDPKHLEPYTDARFGSIIKPKRAEICSGEKGINGSILFIQALMARLPLSECCQILEFFYHLDFPRYSATFLARRPTLLDKLVQITKKFCTRLLSNPSADLVDINRMLWHIWRSIVSDGPWGDPNPWRDLNPQRNLSPQKAPISQRDPGPWGDPNPWTNPDLSCISALLPLQDLASDIISAQQNLKTINEAKTGRTWIHLSTEINDSDFDLVSVVTSIKERLDALLKAISH